MGQDIEGWEKWIYTFVQQHQLPVNSLVRLQESN